MAAFLCFAFEGCVKKRMFKKCRLEDTVGDIISSLLEDNDTIAVTNVNAATIETGPRIEADTDTPIHVLDSFNCKFIFVDTADVTGQKKPSVKAGNAFDILMHAQKSYSSLPNERPPTTAKNRLYNTLLTTLQDQEVGFTPMQVDTVGYKICSTLTNLLWYLDPHHEFIQGRGIKLPTLFAKFTGYNDWKVNKKKKPQIYTTDLEDQIGALGDVLMMPWFHNSKFLKFKTSCEELAEAVQHLHKFHQKQKERTAQNHASKEPVRSLADNWSLKECSHTSIIATDYTEIQS